MTKHRIIILASGVCTLAGILVVAGLASDNRLHAKPRREWKDQAIAKIERRLNNGPSLTSKVGQLASAASSTSPAWGSWVSDDVLVMKNGDWIVCQSICSKQDARIHDLFLGRGSDGKWYYSTFHFCTGKVVLCDERQPDSLVQFADAYWLVPFDGRSNECLKKTWTGKEPWGDGKLQSVATPSPSISQ